MARPAHYTTDPDASAARRKPSVGRRALRGSVNDRAAADAGARGVTSFDALCECGLPGCHERFRLELAAFDAARAGGPHLLVAPGHQPDGAAIVAPLGDALVIERPPFGGEG